MRGSRLIAGEPRPVIGDQLVSSAAQRARPPTQTPGYRGWWAAALADPDQPCWFLVRNALWLSRSASVPARGKRKPVRRKSTGRTETRPASAEAVP
jgi:hypothetical protein